MYQFGTIIFSLVLLGCAGGAKLPAVSVSNNSTAVPVLDWQNQNFDMLAVPSMDDIFTLDDKQQRLFLEYFYSSETASVPEHQRLYNFIETFLDGFDYKGDTFSANIAASNRMGNCMSLAILTKAYALLVNLDVNYKRVNSAPIYQRQNNVMTLSSHVQAHVYAPPAPEHDPQFFKGLPGKIIIDYFPSTNQVIGDSVSSADFVAMYYQNLAAQAIIDDNYDLAYSLLYQAMQQSPNNVETLNTLAVLYKKSGNPSLAQRVYQYATDHTQGSVSLLSNYIILLEEMGMFAQAQVVKSRFNKIDDGNPYRWYDLANQAFEQQNYAAALAFYERSIDVAPYLHESFFGQAKTYSLLGKTRLAKIAMQNAVDLAFKPADELLYIAKLNTLNSY